MSSVLASQNLSEYFFSKDKLYTELASHPAEVKQLLRRYYGEQIDRPIEIFARKFGDDSIALLIDPGIANRVEEFQEFAEIRRLDRVTLTADVRREFSDFLGFETVYRGLRLNDAELNRIAKEGLFSIHEEAGQSAQGRIRSQLLSLESGPDSQKRFRSVTNPFDSPLNLIRQHIRGRAGGFFLSVSSYWQVALGVSHDYGRTDPATRAPTHDVVFKLRIPKIEIIELSGLFSPKNLWGDGPIVRTPFGAPSKGFDIDAVYYSPDDTFKVPLHDPGVEKMVPAQIPLDWIESVEMMIEGSLIPLKLQPMATPSIPTQPELRPVVVQRTLWGRLTGRR